MKKIIRKLSMLGVAGLTAISLAGCASGNANSNSAYGGTPNHIHKEIEVDNNHGGETKPFVMKKQMDIKIHNYLSHVHDRKDYNVHKHQTTIDFGGNCQGDTVDGETETDTVDLSLVKK